MTNSQDGIIDDVAKVHSGAEYKHCQDRRQFLQDSKLSTQTDTEQVSNATRIVNAADNTTEEVGNIVNTNSYEQVKIHPSVK